MNPSIYLSSLIAHRSLCPQQRRNSYGRQKKPPTSASLFTHAMPNKVPKYSSLCRGTWYLPTYLKVSQVGLGLAGPWARQHETSNSSKLFVGTHLVFLSCGPHAWAPPTTEYQKRPPVSLGLVCHYLPTTAKRGLQ